MSVAANADDYTVGRLNMFFPAHNSTPADGNLTGQCVTLVKWFMAEMAQVPSPFSARGDAKLVGKTLVAQGHATEVAWADRRRGDIICYEYGLYGHIAVQLSGGRVFEQNVNMGGVARKLVDRAYVYASRIGSEAEAWRANKNPHVYRLKTYKETGTMDGILSKEDVIAIYGLGFDNPDSQANPAVIKAFTGKYYRDLVNYLRSDPTWQAHANAVQNPPPSGNAPVGMYLKVNKSDIIEVK